MRIEEVIALAGRRGQEVEKVIQDYFFDFKKMNQLEKKLSLKQAARKSGKEYKLLGAVQAIKNLTGETFQKKHNRR